MATTGTINFDYHWQRPADAALMCRVNASVDYSIDYIGNNRARVTITGRVRSVERGPAWTHGTTFYNYVNVYPSTVSASQLPTPPTGDYHSLPYPELGTEVLSGYYKDGPNAEENHYTATTTFETNVVNGRVQVATAFNSYWTADGNRWNIWPLDAWVALDYRPGSRKINGRIMSHNRNGGQANRKVGGVLVEMRTIGGDRNDTGNPPGIRRNNATYNQKLIGDM